jgi:hypothetical protein
MLGFFIVVLTTVDVLLEGVRPRDVVNLGHIISVELKGTEELIEAQTGVASDMGNTSRGRVESAGNHDARHMVDRNHVDGVVNVGATVDLNAAEAESDEEVVVVGHLVENVSTVSRH